MHSFCIRIKEKLAGAALLAGMAGCIALGALPGTAEARPEMAGAGKASFDKIDSDANGLVNAEEFATAYPNMKEQAFVAIDANADGGISLQEWEEFFVSHAKDTMQHNANATSAMQPAGEGAAPELIVPGAKAE